MASYRYERDIDPADLAPRAEKQYIRKERWAWNTGTEENLGGGEEFWQALTAGAVSTVEAEG